MSVAEEEGEALGGRARRKIDLGSSFVGFFLSKKKRLLFAFTFERISTGCPLVSYQVNFLQWFDVSLSSG